MLVDRLISGRAIAMALIVGLLVTPEGKGGTSAPTPGRAIGDAEWMRGVPKGCRLFLFDVEPVASRATADPPFAIVWAPLDSGERRESTVMIPDLDVLRIEFIGGDQKRQSHLRVTAALTPRQACQFELAARRGTVWLKSSADIPRHGPKSAPIWRVTSVEDRTEMIETQLARSTGGQDLERPTLAARPEIRQSSTREVIAVPVDLGSPR